LTAARRRRGRRIEEPPHAGLLQRLAALFAERSTAAALAANSGAGASIRDASPHGIAGRRRQADAGAGGHPVREPRVPARPHDHGARAASAACGAARRRTIDSRRARRELRRRCVHPRSPLSRNAASRRAAGRSARARSGLVRELGVPASDGASASPPRLDGVRSTTATLAENSRAAASVPPALVERSGSARRRRKAAVGSGRMYN